MQGLVNLATAIADAIAVLLPTLCYLGACACFLFAGWSLWSMAGRPQHPHHQRPWVPWVSLLLSGVFASFTTFLTKLNVSAGTNLAVSVTSYAATTPPNASGLLGATPSATIINTVSLFQYFFEAFGALTIFMAIWRWRLIVNGRSNGSPGACAVQFVFGTLCMNIVAVATDLVGYFQAGS